ncbi:YceI family protein [Roseibium sp. M-1]
MTVSISSKAVFGKSLNKSFAALAFVSALAAASLPAEAGPISGTYVLSPAQIDTGFSVKVLGGGPVTGAFKKVSGKMILDQSRPEKSRVTVTVDLRSVQTGNDRVTGFLKSSAMFDVEKYPLATFQSTRVQITGTHTADVEGILTMRGQKKRTNFSVKITGTKSDGHVGFEVSGGFQRSLYGMEAGMPIYADRVNLTISGSGRRG